MNNSTQITNQTNTEIRCPHCGESIVLDKASYPKMFVVRPNLFILLLTILRNAAMSTIVYRAEVDALRNQNFDVEEFAKRFSDFKDSFDKNCEGASKQFQAAITEIDKTIGNLEKTKQALLSSARQLERANRKVEDVTLKKLTRGNPTMQQKFKDAGVDINVA